jgi:hypothetical protein
MIFIFNIIQIKLRMLSFLPNDIVYFLLSFIKTKNKFLVINKKISKTAQKNIVSKWKNKGRLLIDLCNSEKSNLDTSNLLSNNIFFQYLEYLPGAYKAYDKLNTPIFFSAYDMSITCKYPNNLHNGRFKHCLIMDIKGHTIRGAILINKIH